MGTFQDTRGDDAAYMGDALPIAELGRGLSASRIATCTAYTCAVVRETHGLKCWVRVPRAPVPIPNVAPD